MALGIPEGTPILKVDTVIYLKEGRPVVWRTAPHRLSPTRSARAFFFAHVRASTGTSSTRANCHPFVFGPWLFMHNGQIGGYAKIKRQLEHEIPDALYAHRHGTTDSEVLMLANGLETDPLGALRQTFALIASHMRKAGIEEPLKVTAAFTKGERVHAVRYSTDLEPPTLYTKPMLDREGMLIVSEPLDDVRADWTSIPRQHVLTAARTTTTTTEPLG